MTHHLIVLPGNSAKNRAWGELMLSTYGPWFDSSFMQSYRHWENGEGSIDFTQELEALAAHIKTLPAGTTITLFAKSVGSLMGFLAVNSGVIQPAKCAFFGIPFDLAATGVFKDDWSAVNSFTLPALAFHNINDPTANYGFTKDVLASHAPHIQLVTTPEADHSYHNVEQYTDTLKKFLQL